MVFVFDTNVLVSALLLPNSTPRQALDLVLARGKLLVSSFVLSELHEVLGRKKFRPYIDEEDVRLFLDVLAHEAELVDVQVEITICRDPSDNKFLEVAILGRATHIITGNADLLALNPFRGIQIINPQALLERFSS